MNKQPLNRGQDQKTQGSDSTLSKDRGSKRKKAKKQNERKGGAEKSARKRKPTAQKDKKES